MLAVTGCAADPVAVDVPVAPPEEARMCQALERALPARLDGRDSVETRPPSSRTAAWGDPPLVLRCGVGKPEGLTQTSEVLEVNGVEWYLDESARGYTFTTVGRAAFVELRVPASVDRREATAPLVDLARPVAKAIPVARG